MSAQTASRYINWCANDANASDCFPEDEECYCFNPDVVNLPMLLVISGMFSSYLEAHEAGYRGFVPYGWWCYETKDICISVWNPDPEWDYDVS